MAELKNPEVSVHYHSLAVCYLSITAIHVVTYCTLIYVWY